MNMPSERIHNAMLMMMIWMVDVYLVTYTFTAVLAFYCALYDFVTGADLVGLRYDVEGEADEEEGQEGVDEQAGKNLR